MYGCCVPTDPNKVKLPGSLIRKIDEAFALADKDGSGEVDLDEASNLFGRFQGLAAKKLLKDMDENNDNKISREEWHFYFKRVLASREYTVQDIQEELSAFMGNREMFTFQLQPLSKTNNGSCELKKAEGSKERPTNGTKVNTLIGADTVLQQDGAKDFGEKGSPQRNTENSNDSDELTAGKEGENGTTPQNGTTTLLEEA